MNTYKADLHIHTILSPCGDLFMSPANIISEASKKGLDIIGITDHNSTRQAPLIYELGKKDGIFVLCGAEVTTKEEAHCLCFMPDMGSLNIFQTYLDDHLPDIKNDNDKFGFQVCVNNKEDIVFEEERLLLSAIDQSVDQIEQKVHELNGLFIPAHVNRPMFSLISQLGFVPPDLKFDALELSRHITIKQFKKQNIYLKDATFMYNSDAHIVSDIGTVYTEFKIVKRSFEEIKKALHKENNRSVSVPL